MSIARRDYHVTQITAASTTWSNLVLPTNSAGDLLLMWIYEESNATLNTPPSGWTSRTGPTTDGANDGRAWTYYKISSGSESNPSLVLSSAQRGQVVIAAYSGVDNTTPFDVTSVATGFSSASSWSVGPITPTTAGAFLVSFIGADLSASQSQPYFAITSPFTAYSSTEDSSSTTEVGAADGAWTSGATSAAWSTAGTADNAVASIHALSPAAGGGNPPVNLDASGGTATAAGGTDALTVAWTSTTGTATAVGTTPTLSVSFTASTGTAAASGSTPGLTVRLTAASGAATAGGGTVQALQGVFVDASGGTASTGGSVALTVRWAASSGAATASGGSVTVSRTVTAASGAANASGTSLALTVTYLAATGTATAIGGSVTTSADSGLSASGGNATAGGGTVAFSPRWTAASGVATASGGTVNRVNSAMGGSATGAGGTASLRWTFSAVTGNATAVGGTATATAFVPTLGTVDGASSVSRVDEGGSSVGFIEAAGVLSGIQG